MEHQELVRTINIAIKNALPDIHTMTIGRVTTVNTDTIDVQPVINRVVNGESVKLPIFKSVPMITLQGGTSYEHFPIAVGDYALLFVTERCFDRWYNGQDEMSPLEERMHDYSDCFALVGVNPLGGAIPIPDVIRRNGDEYYTGDSEHEGNVDHTGHVDQTGDYDQIGNYTVEGDVDITGGTTQVGNTDLTGNATVSGLLTAGTLTLTSGGSFSGGVLTIDNVIVNGVDLDDFIQNHVHSGVMAGGSNTGAPV